MSHSPAPWAMRRLIDNTGKPYSTLYEAHIDCGPCMIWAPIGNAEQEANANLICASPDLLTACKAVLASLEKLASDGEIIWLDPPHVMSGVHESAIERLKNVIAQAEGRPVE